MTIRGGIADILGLEGEGLTYEIPGVNHFVWLTHLYHEGDVLNEAYNLLDGWVLLYHMLEDGRRQILEILRRFREAGFEAARVTTSEHPFFQPALRLYKALGFRETGRPAGGPDARFRLIELEKPSLLEPPLL